MDNEEVIIKKKSMAGEVLSRLVRNKGAVIGLIILAIVTIMCLLAPVIAPYHYDAQNVMDKFLSPCKEHIMGTDELGRDIFSRILYGGRVSILVAISATAISAVFGIILGMISGYYGGKTDNILMRILDIFMAIPYLLLAIAVSTAVGSGLSSAIFAVGVSGIPSFARVVRGPILSVKGQEFIEAARSIDASDKRIMFKHLLPNVMSPLIVAATGGIASAINSVAALSFLGLGVPAPYPEWGAMISSARQYIMQHAYMVTFPGIAIALVVIALNLFGDGLRDAMDPRLKS